MVVSVSMDSEPSAVGPASVVPTVVDQAEAARLRVGAMGPRDQEFLEFVRASGRYLLRTAVLLCGDPVPAEELVQATYERTYRSWRVARDGDPQAYARRVLVNLRVDGWRRTRRTLAAARRALRRSWGRRALGGVAGVVAVVVGLTAVGPIELPGLGTLVMPGGHDVNALPNQGEPPVYPRQRLLHDVADLERQVLPVAEDLGITRYIDDEGAWGRPACRVFTWSHGAFLDRDSSCANPDDPGLSFDTASEAAFTRVSDAIEHSGVNVNRIEKGGWGPGTSFHVRDDSWRWNWYYSYDPDTPADAAPEEVRTQTRLGVRLQVHVGGHWWFTVEPDD
jgi:hypothetical protein